MLSASRVVIRELRGSKLVSRSICQGASKVAPHKRLNIAQKCEVKKCTQNNTLFRAYSTTPSSSLEQEKIVVEAAVPQQADVITVANVNDVTPELQSLSRFLPKSTPSDELEIIEARVREAKAKSETPSASDLLWVMLANLKLGKMDRATVAWNDLVAQKTPDLLHWNLILAHAASKKDWVMVGEVYEHFKLAVIKRRLPGPSPITYNILIKAFSERGDMPRVMEIYEDMFRNQWVPEIHHLRSVLKCAALSGNPKLFHRFYSRLVHKGIHIKGGDLKDHIDIWGKYKAKPDYLKKQHITTGDFSAVLDYVLRVRNYRRAAELINDCRDVLDIQPDARMYETILAACIRDGHMREQARALKKRFHKYPKGIEVREEHFEFGAFLDDVLTSLGKDASCAPRVDFGEQIKFSRTTRKQSRGLFGANPRVRYNSGWDLNEFEWVPEYVQRKKQFELAQKQTAKAAELQELIAKAKSEAKSL